MLSVLSTGGGMQLYGVGGFGASAETFQILGVPFQWEKKNVYPVGDVYNLVGTNSIWIKKDKIPSSLAKAIDQLIAKAATELLKKKPDLAKDPKELIKQAKYDARLTSPEKDANSTYLSAALSNAYLGKVTKVNGKSTPNRSILVKDMGTAYRVRLQDNPSGQGFPGIGLLFDIAGGIAGGITASVNFAIDGLEALMGALAALGCKLSETVVADLAKTAVNTYAAGHGPVTGTLTTAATSTALQKIKSLCSPSTPGITEKKTPPPEVVVPWYKRPSTYVIGGSVIGLGTIITLAVRR